MLYNGPEELLSHLQPSKINKIALIFLGSYLALYSVLLFYNLHLIPLAWLDEIMGLDPAIQLLQGNGFSSYLWPQIGSENIFLAYLPLQGMAHFLQQSVLPFDIYWVRFPWACYLLIGAFILYKTLRVEGYSLLLSLGIIILLINEKSLFETTRGVRIESLMFLLIGITLYAKAYGRNHLQVLAVSILLFSHPNIWPFCLVLFMDASIKYNTEATSLTAKVFKPNILWLYPTTFLLAFLLYIDFDVNSLTSQLVHQGSDHASSGNFWDRCMSHFYTRFWPYYLTQPWIPMIIYSALIGSIWTTIRRNWDALSLSIVLTHIVWLIILGPFHRYNPILVIISVLWCSNWLINQSIPRGAVLWKWVFSFVLVLSTVDVLSRHAMAIAQRKERNPYPVIEWLQNEVPQNERYLITGHDIAYYAIANDSNGAYFIYNIPPYKYNFENYDRYLIISDSQWSGASTISQYQLQSDRLSEMFNSKTYKKLNLQEVQSAKEYRIILERMDSNNRKEVWNK